MNINNRKETKAASAHFIQGLDGLRAIAFLLVFFFHCSVFPVGWVGVQFFFVLSGFLITPILIEYKSSSEDVFFRRFLYRRSLRIFPVYYLFLLVCTVLVFIVQQAKGESEHTIRFFDYLPYAMSYTYNFWHSVPGHIEFQPFSHIWSLSIEEQFYLLWPVLIFLVSGKSIKKLLYILIFTGPILRLVSYQYFDDLYRGHSTDEKEVLEQVTHAIYMMPWSHFEAFAFGALISQIKLIKPYLQFYSALMLVPLVGFIAQYVHGGSISFMSFGYSFRLEPVYQSIWGYSLLNYFFAVLIYVVAREGFANKFLENKSMKHIGKISYGAYLFHFPIIMLVVYIVKSYIGFSGGIPIFILLLAVIISLVLTLLLASVSYKYVEAPINKFKDKKYSKRNVG